MKSAAKVAMRLTNRFRPIAKVIGFFINFKHEYQQTILVPGYRDLYGWLFHRVDSLYIGMTWFPIFVIWLAVAVCIAVGWSNLGKKI